MGKERKEKDIYEKDLNTTEDNYYNSKGDINEIETQLREIAKNRENIDFIIGEFKEKENEIKLALASMKERLSVEFNVKIEDLADQTPSGKYKGNRYKIAE